MVARQDRHPVATLDAHGPQSVGDGVRRVVEFFERELAIVVDDGGAIGGAACVQRRDHAELAPAPDVGEERGDVLRRLQLQRTGLEHLAGVVQFRRPALGILLDFGRCLQRKIG